MEEDLLARLRGASAIAALVGTANSRPAINWIERANVLPCVTLQNISAGRTYTFAGASDYEGATVQVDCWGGTFGATKLLERAIVAEIETGRTTGDTEFDAGFLLDSRSFDPEDLGSGIKVFRQSLDLAIWHRPA